MVTDPSGTTTQVRSLDPSRTYSSEDDFVSSPAEPDRHRGAGLGTSRSRRSQLVFDTGSMHTVIMPGILDELGFNPRDGVAITGVYSAIGKEQGYLIKVPMFSALGFVHADFPIHVFELAEQYDIDGIIGLSFLHRYNYTVSSAEGQILVEEIAAAAAPPLT